MIRVFDGHFPPATNQIPAEEELEAALDGFRDRLRTQLQDEEGLLTQRLARVRSAQSCVLHEDCRTNPALAQACNATPSKEP